MSNIPIGADVFFGNCGGGPCGTCKNSYYGHIGIYIGNGEFVHATGGTVQKSSLSAWSGKYRGWGWHDYVSVDGSTKFFDFWGVDEGVTINNTYKLWFKQEGYGSGSSCDVNIHIDGKDAQSAVGTIYQDNSGLFSFELDTIKYTNGEHTIYAVIRNNFGEEKWVSRKVLILNTRMAIDNISGGKGTISIQGLAFVDNSPVICDVEVYIGNERIATFKADNESTDVGNHRFNEVIKTSYTGKQTVTVKAINPESKAYISMQRTVTITSITTTTKATTTTTKPTTTTTKLTTTTTKPTTTTTTTIKITTTTTSTTTTTTTAETTTTETTMITTTTTKAITTTPPVTTEPVEDNKVAGDANGDSAVNLKDVIIIRQFVAKWDVDVDTEAADVNNDGVVDLKDVILIRRFIAGGWDVELI